MENLFILLCLSSVAYYAVILLLKKVGNDRALRLEQKRGVPFTNYKPDLVDYTIASIVFLPVLLYGLHI